MAEPLQERPLLADALPPGRGGELSGPPGLVVREQPPQPCVQLAARAGSVAALAETMRPLGLTLPGPGGWSAGGGWRAIWVGPERWLVFGPASDRDDIERSLRDRLGPLASVSDQSDARVVLRLSGPRVREALSKGIGIDLHPRAFSAGRAAATLAAQIGVVIWQLDDAPTYELAVARSYAGSLAEWLVGAAAEYGLQVQ